MPDTGIPSLNPQRGTPYNYFDRSVDKNPPGGGPGGGGSFDGDWPLKLVAVDTENVKVLLGTVNGLIPTDVETNIDVSGTDGTWYFYMHASVSGTSISSPEVLSNVGGPVPSDTSTDTYRLIGQVDVASSVITGVRPSMAWSQNVSICTADSPPYYWTTGA